MIYRAALVAAEKSAACNSIYKKFSDSVSVVSDVAPQNTSYWIGRHRWSLCRGPMFDCLLGAERRHLGSR